MSTKSLCAVVALLLVGTAISVFEYLESSRVPIHRVDPCVVDPASCRALEHAPEQRSVSAGSAEILLPSACPRSACESQRSSRSTSIQMGNTGIAPEAPRRTADAEPGVCTAPPSVFQPTAEAVGG
jgi:hypothetical protein